MASRRALASSSEGPAPTKLALRRRASSSAFSSAAAFSAAAAATPVSAISASSSCEAHLRYASEVERIMSCTKEIRGSVVASASATAPTPTPTPTSCPNAGGAGMGTTMHPPFAMSSNVCHSARVDDAMASMPASMRAQVASSSCTRASLARRSCSKCSFIAFALEGALRISASMASATSAKSRQLSFSASDAASEPRDRFSLKARSFNFSSTISATCARIDLSRYASGS
mmetsp:Transcript_24131/g.67165  ORF Transcript_24131/g.67165 Transcript_24131/m.67165 type:complete len:230 (+) Transcript_24131:775-1464(+)